MDRHLMYDLLKAVDEKKRLIPAEFGLKRGPFDAAMHELQQQGYISARYFSLADRDIHIHTHYVHGMMEFISPLKGFTLLMTTRSKVLICQKK